jgi:hypothetical protein
MSQSYGSDVRSCLQDWATTTFWVTRHLESKRYTVIQIKLIFFKKNITYNLEYIG